MQLERGQQVGRYLIVQQIGAGGQGVVYSAYDPELERKVALKLLRPKVEALPDDSEAAPDDARKRLQREAQAMARVSHPNVVSVFDVGTHGEDVFVAMEFIEGATLKKWLKEQHRSWTEILEVCIGAAKGLAAAHAVGLVHRDFKPDNVLVGGNGSPHVTDFGLARFQGAAEERTNPGQEREVSSPSLSSPLTQVGRIVGTPNYMPPEQILGLTPDARSDQFSFCATLYWALFGTRPFDPSQFRGQVIEQSDALEHHATPEARAKLAGLIQPPPSTPGVPSWLKKAILRGLAPLPEDRFASMNALLAQLDRQRRTGRNRWLASAMVLALTVGVAAGAYALNRQRICQGAGAQLEGVYDSSRTQLIRAKFLQTGAPWADQAFRAVKETLDGYAQRWVVARTEACEATRLRGEQSEQMLERRVLCLERARKGLDALARALLSADEDMAQRAVDAASALPSIRACGDVESVMAVQAPPDDPDRRRVIDQLGEEVAAATSLRDLGRRVEAVAAFEALAPRIEGAGYGPLRAQFDEKFGWLLMLQGDPKRAHQRLASSLVAAEEARDDRTRVWAAARLVYVVSFGEGRTSDALEWGQLAKATLRRVGGDTDIELEIEENLSFAYRANYQMEDARQALLRALALAEKAEGPKAIRRANLLAPLAEVYTALGNYDEAKRALDEAQVLVKEVYGSQHPRMAQVDYALALFGREVHDLDLALTSIEAGVAISEATAGKASVAVAIYLDLLATTLHEKGQYARALEVWERDLDIRQKHLAPDDPDFLYPHDGIGQALFRLGRLEPAIASFGRALAIKSTDERTVGESRFTLAKALWASRKDRRKAIETAKAAHSSFLAAQRPQQAKEVADWLQGTFKLRLTAELPKPSP